jgi:hypothetical protein
MSRCVLVVSIPRAGSSCVAGVLHKLGVDMGEGHFQNKDKFNPKGYFEDLQWRYANQRITGRGYSIAAARTWILHSGCERHQDRQKAKSDIPQFG